LRKFSFLGLAEIVLETVSTIKEGLRRGHLVKSFLAGYLETIRYFKSRKSEALKKNDPEQVGRSSDRRESLGGYMRSLPDDGRPTSKGLEVVLDALAKEDPKEKSLAVAQLLDLRYLP
jgi:hypothetical protein